MGSRPDRRRLFLLTSAGDGAISRGCVRLERRANKARVWEPVNSCSFCPSVTSGQPSDDDQHSGMTGPSFGLGGLVKIWPRPRLRPGSGTRHAREGHGPYSPPVGPSALAAGPQKDRARATAGLQRGKARC
jgi:hypothetical protein